MEELLKYEFNRYKKLGLNGILGFALLYFLFNTFYDYGLHYWPAIESSFQDKNGNLKAFLYLSIIMITSFFSIWVPFWIISNLKLIECYRVEPEAKWLWERDTEQWKKERFKIIGIVFGQSIILSTLMLALKYYFGKIGMSTIANEIPSKFYSSLERKEMILQLSFVLLIDDALQYWMHRIYHISRFLYKHIHSYHHYYETFFLIGTYNHIIEYFTSAIVKLSLVYKITSTLETHTGYEIPWSPLRILPFTVNSSYHNHHHTDNDGNYSQYLLFWDFFMDTNKNFIKNRVFPKDRND